jgi:small subunit ribosomal protein S21
MSSAIGMQMPFVRRCVRTTLGATPVQVFVRDNNVDQALRVLKKKMQREGVFREMRRRRFYEKPSDKATREKTESIRRRRKLARKQAIRDGLIAAPAKKPAVRGDGGRGSGPNTPTPSLRGAAQS